jgi:hypothetical protein
VEEEEDENGSSSSNFSIEEKEGEKFTLQVRRTNQASSKEMVLTM